MIDALAWMEQTRLSVFVREDFCAYFVLLIFHAWGMAFLITRQALKIFDRIQDGEHWVGQTLVP